MNKGNNKYAEELIEKGKKPIVGETYNTMFGKGKVIQDFLPSPAELKMNEDTQKVTIALTKRSISFFKTQATNHRLKYQIMIRDILDKYAAIHE